MTVREPTGVKGEIAGEIDIDGLWYWLWQKDYRRWADQIPVEILKKLIIAADAMEDARKALDDEGYMF